MLPRIILRCFCETVGHANGPLEIARGPPRRACGFLGHAGGPYIGNCNGVVEHAEGSRGCANGIIGRASGFFLAMAMDYSGVPMGSSGTATQSSRAL